LQKNYKHLNLDDFISPLSQKKETNEKKRFYSGDNYYFPDEPNNNATIHCDGSPLVTSDRFYHHGTKLTWAWFWELKLGHATKKSSTLSKPGNMTTFITSKTRHAFGDTRGARIIAFSWIFFFSCRTWLVTWYC
jgi:hypothetical protein